MDNQIKKASERYFNLTGKTTKSEKNIHRIFEDKDVDAIIVATTNHWHAYVPASNGKWKTFVWKTL